MVNSNTRENRVEQVSKRHSCLFKVLNTSSKEHLRFLKLKNTNYSRSKIMNHGKSKTPHWLKSSIKLEITMKKPSTSCFLREPNKCKNYLMKVNISSNNCSMKSEELSCLTILQVGRTSLKLESNMLIIKARILKNGLSLSDTIAISITLEKKRMTNIEKNNTLEKS